jgi:hypothetical protein
MRSKRSLSCVKVHVFPVCYWSTQVWVRGKCMFVVSALEASSAGLGQIWSSDLMAKTLLRRLNPAGTKQKHGEASGGAQIQRMRQESTTSNRFWGSHRVCPWVVVIEMSSYSFPVTQMLVQIFDLILYWIYIQLWYVWKFLHRFAAILAEITLKRCSIISPSPNWNEMLRMGIHGSLSCTRWLLTCMPCFWLACHVSKYSWKDRYCCSLERQTWLSTDR